VSVTPRPHLTPGKEPVPIVQEAGWASGTVWTGAENLAPTGIRSPDRPARRQSLYRLSYPGPLTRNLTPSKSQHYLKKTPEVKTSVLTFVLKLVLLFQYSGDSGSNPGHGIVSLRVFLVKPLRCVGNRTTASCHCRK
jgi:hypothetical protein